MLEQIRGPADLQHLSQAQLEDLAHEIRDFLIHKVAATGGHLGPNLGVVELTLALHRVFDSPHDPILFDTGYAERFLTETRSFPNRLYRMVTPVSFAPGQGLAAQLDARGLDRREVGHVFLSHFHADHVAGLADFPNARVHCSAAAWSQARSLRGIAALRALAQVRLFSGPQLLARGDLVQSFVR